MNRREFVYGVGGAAVLRAIEFTPSLPASRIPVPESLSKIGVQLYTIRREMQAGAERTLEQVARIGYKEVECWHYHGRPAKEFRALLDANGLTAPSAHTADLNAIRNRLPQVVEDAVTVGHRYVICASLPASEMTADGYKRIAAEFNRAGAVSAQSGVTLGFHNHDGEFKALGDTNGYDILLAECDPKLVTMQMDLFWTKKGGSDPLAYFAKYPGRFSSVHVKDMDAAGTMVDVGAGQMPFGQYFAQSAKAGIKHYFVEHDSPGDPMASITASYKHLSALKY